MSSFVVLQNALIIIHHRDQIAVHLHPLMGFNVLPGGEEIYWAMVELG
jgi:hypothetical protein